MIKKVFRWLKYNPPGYLTMEGWDLFDKEFRRKAPVRYFLKKIARLVQQLVRLLRKNFREKILFRFFIKYHILTTGLPPGYSFFDERLLHGSFNEFCAFIEDDYIHQHFSVKDRWYLYIPYFRKKSRISRRSLILDLYQEKKRIVQDSSLSSDEIRHARLTLDVLELYYWWQVKRPQRYSIPEPNYSFQGLKNGPLDPAFDETAADYVAYLDYYKQREKQDLSDYDEDTEMLIKLVKNRQDFIY